MSALVSDEPMPAAKKTVQCEYEAVCAQRFTGHEVLLQQVSILQEGCTITYMCTFLAWLIFSSAQRKL